MNTDFLRTGHNHFQLQPVNKNKLLVCQGFTNFFYFKTPGFEMRCIVALGRIGDINPFNAELNPICYLLALLGAHHILHVSRIRVKFETRNLTLDGNISQHQVPYSHKFNENYKTCFENPNNNNNKKPTLYITT
jgi:hypothetical protein